MSSAAATGVQLRHASGIQRLRTRIAGNFGIRAVPPSHESDGERAP
jgi:hypothetical protein